jgi:uncharacterized protein (DUF849 family)
MPTVKACLNGDRTRAQHPAVPLTPEHLADEAYAVQQAGASVVHVHPRSRDGSESLDWADIRPAVQQIRIRCPALVVGVSTRQEIEPDLDRRLELLAAWSGPPDGPDIASVNWHEDGAVHVAAPLADGGIGIEAGLFTPTAARKLGTGNHPELVRVLVEALPGISPGGDGVDAARRTLAALGAVETDLVVHGEQEWAWPVLRWALDNGHGIRAGFEDMLTGPGGEPVDGNADLLRAALRLRNSS